MTITNYIKERIEHLRYVGNINRSAHGVFDGCIDELQAVLSKIEELRQEEIADARGESIFNDK